ncbi:undecaprenyl-diphosphatase [Stackebrandtia endophytica]|uniref:Undecaprenyl-diphosphatase n=1 Tax=Stackebrandtia endophytica TaxID=1496996 RepID=A0A543AUF0_9ACTN|nr:phosphatase PAP2 family protein [Stackebrandtia endophytica]TQL76175.1 undecaprenyl-diphosphatase [Stackebrandtia endophytica]
MNLISPPIGESSRRDDLTRFHTRGLLIAAVVLGGCALIAFPIRQHTYAAIVDWATASQLDSLIGFIANGGLWILVAPTLTAAAWCFVRARRRFWTSVSAGVGVIAAYLLGEGIKILVARPRPCTDVDVPTVLVCPGAGDWSFPSNHSVLAAAFATACMFTLVHSAWIVMPIALAIAGSRVAVGVHDVHDVLSGLALGIAVVTGAVLLLRPVLDRALDGGEPARRTTPTHCTSE